MINRLFSTPTKLLIARKNLELCLSSKRFKATKLMYRRIGDEQATSDWFGSVFFISAFISTLCINAYMNWDEFKLADPHGYISDTSILSQEELGIPDDALGYAKVKEEILDIGAPGRREKIYDYHFRYRRNKEEPNPFNM